MNTRLGKGFTLVEILIVVIVIVILAAISTALYRNVQVQANDVAITDYADKASDALALYISHHGGNLPNAGWLSSGPIGAGPECAGWGGWGWFASGAYPCTLEDVLVLNGYLPAGFSTKIPQNSLAPSGTTYNQSLIIDSYDTTNRRYMVWWRLEDPSAADTANFNTQMQKCGINPAGGVNQRDSSGMRNGTCVSY